MNYTDSKVEPDTFLSLQPKLNWLKERRRKVLEYAYHLAIHDMDIHWALIE